MAPSAAARIFRARRRSLQALESQSRLSSNGGCGARRRSDGRFAPAVGGRVRERHFVFGPTYTRITRVSLSFALPGERLGADYCSAGSNASRGLSELLPQADKRRESEKLLELVEALRKDGLLKRDVSLAA